MVQNALTQVKTYPGADCSSDHVPVIAAIKLKLKRIVKKNIISKRQLITLRKDEDIKTRYNVVVKNKYEAMKDEIAKNSAEQQWELLQEAIKVGNEKVIPTSKRRAKSQWMTERILIMMDERRKFKGIDDQRYKSINRMIHKECNKARETWTNDRCMDIENLSKRDQQMMYEKVSELTREIMYKQGKAIKKKEGTVVMGKEEVMERWDEYISDLFMDNRQENINIQYNGEGPPILKKDVEDSMNKMKFGMAVGNNGIALEMLKALGNFAVEKITTLANKIYESGELTSHMSKSVLIAIHKVKGTLDCENIVL